MFTDISLVQRTGLRLVPGKLYTPQLPINSGTALDIELTIALPATGSTNVELQVLASATGGHVNQSSGYEVDAATISLNVSGCMGDGLRSGALVWRGRNTGPTNGGRGTPFTILSGEQSVHLRVLVDRSVVEVFAGGGRAHIVAGEFADVGHTFVHMLASGSSPVAVGNLSIWSMDCGWSSS